MKYVLAALLLFAIATPARASEPFGFVLYSYCSAADAVCPPDAPQPCPPCSNSLTDVLIPEPNDDACETARRNLGRTIPDSGLARFADACFSLRSGASR